MRLCILGYNLSGPMPESELKRYRSLLRLVVLQIWDEHEYSFTCIVHIVFLTSVPYDTLTWSSLFLLALRWGTSRVSVRLSYTNGSRWLSFITFALNVTVRDSYAGTSKEHARARVTGTAVSIPRRLTFLSLIRPIDSWLWCINIAITILDIIHLSFI
jgi:hypothetical protein